MRVLLAIIPCVVLAAEVKEQGLCTICTAIRLNDEKKFSSLLGGTVLNERDESGKLPYDVVFDALNLRENDEMRRVEFMDPDFTSPTHGDRRLVFSPNTNILKKIIDAATPSTAKTYSLSPMLVGYSVSLDLQGDLDRFPLPDSIYRRLLGNTNLPKFQSDCKKSAASSCDQPSFVDIYSWLSTPATSKQAKIKDLDPRQALVFTDYERLSEAILAFPTLLSTLMSKGASVTVSDLCAVLFKKNLQSLFGEIFDKTKVMEINKRCPATTSDWSGTPLHAALKANDENAIDLILALPHVDLNIVDTDGLTSLTYAIDIKSTKYALKMLTNSAVKVNPQPNDASKSALFIAMEKDDIEVTKALLKRADLDVNGKGRSAICPMKALVEKYRMPTIKKYAGSGNAFAAVVNDPSVDLTCGTDISGATEENYNDVSNMFAVDIACAPLYNTTLLSVACPILLEASAKKRVLNKPNGAGYLAIHSAVRSRNHVSFDTVIKFTPELVNEKSVHSRSTALILSCKCNFVAGICLSGAVPQIIDSILRVEGVQLDATDKDGSTALHHATAAKDTATVKTLLSKRANANIKNGEGKTPLDIASAFWVGGGELKEILQKYGGKLGSAVGKEL